MCEPISTAAWIATAMSGLQAVGGFMEQSVWADAEDQRQEELNARTIDEANSAFVLETEGLARRQRENDTARDASVFTANIESMKAKAAAKVSAAEGGVAGVSIESLLSDYDASLARYRNDVFKSAEFEDRQILADIKGLDAKRRSRIENSKPSGAKRPSSAVAALDFGASAASIYAAQTGKRKPKTTNTNPYKKKR